MAVTYNLLPIPKWYFADKAGRPLAGGFMFTYSSLTRQPKIVYQDLGGTLAWTNPVIFDANGTQGPFYWAFNSAAPTDLYFIEIYDADLVLQWTIDNYGGPGSGGGSVVTTTTSIKNLVANNVFYRNLGTSALGLAKNVTLAPGAHSGLAGNAFPDINFIKDSTAASDQITFTAFPFGTNPVPTDITPPYYLSYVCNNIAGDEGIKVVRYPITANVKNLENQAVTISFWARRNPASGSPTIAINSYQFFGDGPGATTAFRQPLMSYDLSTIPGWNKYVLNTTIPSASTKTVGACGNSALFLEFAYPINAACNIDHTKLSLYAATLTGTPDFDTFDQIESLVNSARTGDIRTSMNSFQPFGWVSMNDGTIGSATSGGTTRANVDTFPLFSTLYLNVIDTYAPVSGGRTGAGNTLAECITDYSANKTIALTKMLGRAIASMGQPSVGGTNWVLGQFTGTEGHLITLADLPAILGQVPGANATGGVPPTYNSLVGWTGGGAPGGAVNVENPAGMGTQITIMQPTTFVNVFIKL